MKRIAILLVAVLASLLAACSEDNKVGAGVDLNIKEAADQGRLGARTTTTVSPSETTVPAAKAGIGAETTTTTARATTTTAAPTTTQRQAPTLDIRISSDTSGVSQFDPSQARVFLGSIVKWTNTDSVTRSVQFDDGSVDSGPIAPGASFTYTADRVGRFNYHDGTRPYAVGAVEVIAR